MRAVVFDLFGTLVPNLEPAAWRACNAACAAILGAPAEDFARAWGACYRERMDGRLRDDDRVFAGTVGALGLRAADDALRAAADLRRAFLLDALAPKPDALAMLDAIRARGFRLALATDCSSGTPSLLDRTALGPYFEVRAVSAYLGVTKPDPAIYRHVLEGLGVAGDRCLYVGDGNSEELPGARRHAMTTVWVDNGDSQHHRERFVPEADHAIRALSDLPGLVDALTGHAPGA